MSRVPNLTVRRTTMAVAFILQYMARGTSWVEARLRVLPVRWIGLGLLLAGAPGLPLCCSGDRS